MWVLGAGRHFRTAEFSADLRDNYTFYGIGGTVSDGQFDAGITKFVREHAAWLGQKRVALFGLGAPGSVSENAFAPLQEILGAAVRGTETIAVTPQTTDLAALAAAGLRLKAIRDGGDVLLPPAEMKKHVEDFLGGHKYCILCTGAGDRVRGTAVTYTYHRGHIYIVCEGAAKFANLLLNENVCIALHAPYNRGQRHAGIQVSGKVAILDPASDAYRRMIEIKGSDYRRLTTLPWIVWGLDVTLQKAEFWWSEWKNQGVSPKQSYDFEGA